MGDLLLTLPAVSALRRAFPRARISLMVKEALPPLIDGYPDADEVIPWPAGTGRGLGEAFRAARFLRKRRFDGIVLFNPTQAFHLGAFLSGIPVRVGYRRKMGFLLTHSIPDTKAARGLHESDYNLELVRRIGIDAAEVTLRLIVTDRAKEEARRLLESAGAGRGPFPLAVHPWTSNPDKGVGEPFFREVVRILSGEGTPLLIIGQPEESKRRFVPAGKPSPGHVIDLTGNLPLGLLPAVLSGCSLLLSNDSGPAHVASAVGTPVLVAAPGSHRRQLTRWQPMGTGGQLLFDPTPEEAAGAIRHLLRKPRAGPS